MAKQLLDGERGTIFWMDPDDLVVVGVDTNHTTSEPDKPHSHPLWDKRILLPLDKNLTASIFEDGILETVLCNVVVEKDKNVAYVVNGRRRTLHAREAKKLAIRKGEPDAIPLVPCLAKKNMKDETVDMVSIGLNELAVQDPVMLKAEKAYRLTQRGRSPKRIAQVFSVTPQTVTMWVELIGLAPAVREAIDANQITPTAAVKLKDLSHEDQVTEIKTLLESGVKPTATEVHARASKKHKGGDDGVRAPKKRLLAKILVVGKEDLPDELRMVLKGIAYAAQGTDPRIAGFADLVKQANEKKTKEDCGNGLTAVNPHPDSVYLKTRSIFFTAAKFWFVTFLFSCMNTLRPPPENHALPIWMWRLDVMIPTFLGLPWLIWGSMRVLKYGIPKYEVPSKKE